MSLNEVAMLPFFFRHYDRFVDRYFVYDDGSTDGTIEYLQQHPNVEVHRFVRTNPDSFVLSALDLHNSAWKLSRGQADWVIWTAIDEHLYHPDFGNYLERMTKMGVTAVPALGYQMLAEARPQEDDFLFNLVRSGAPFWEMNKLSLFKPDALTETHFEIGRHRAKPAGRVVVPDEDELLNLHYKYMGVLATHVRHQKLLAGLRPIDNTLDFGHRYQFSIARLQQEFDVFKRRSIDVLKDNYNHHALHQEARWWRAAPVKGA
jgi:hypothetical protein